MSWKHIPGLTNSFFLKLLFLEGFENISSNSYVIKDSILTIIDPGNDYTAFIELFELGFKPSDIKRVIITHGDFDHCMGTLELMRYPSIKMGGLEVILHEMGPATLKEIIEKEGGKVIEVKGGETLKLDDLELKVFYTPGHTIDSICLYHEPTRTLFTGDTVLPHAIAAPNPAARGSIRDYLSSLRILMKIPVEVILPGHGMPIIGNCKEAIESTYEGIIKDLTGEVEYDKAAETLLKYGYFEDAIFCCDKGINKDPEKLNFPKLKALSLINLGKFNEAIEILNKILEKQKDALSLVTKGYALMGLQKYEESIKYFDEALSINPNIKEALIYKCLALIFLGKVEEAMKIPEFKEKYFKIFEQEIKKLKSMRK